MQIWWNDQTKRKLGHGYEISKIKKKKRQEWEALLGGLIRIKAKWTFWCTHTGYVQKLTGMFFNSVYRL